VEMLMVQPVMASCRTGQRVGPAGVAQTNGAWAIGLKEYACGNAVRAR
jgi:hypothetical protein